MTAVAGLTGLRIATLANRDGGGAVGMLALPA